MIEILEQTSGKVVATKATETLTEADYSKLLPKLNYVVEMNKKVRWFFEKECYSGWELKAFWEDIKFDARHANDFEKVAMVGEKKWEEWMTDGMKSFTSAEVKYFETSQKEEAMQWMKS